jgi:hypothetical protein
MTNGNRSTARAERRWGRRGSVDPPGEAQVSDSVPEVMLLDRDQGRELLDRRSRRMLGIGGDEFLSAYDAGTLDLNRREVQAVAILIPFVR